MFIKACIPPTVENVTSPFITKLFVVMFVFLKLPTVIKDAAMFADVIKVVIANVPELMFVDVTFVAVTLVTLNCPVEILVVASNVPVVIKDAAMFADVTNVVAAIVPVASSVPVVIPTFTLIVPVVKLVFLKLLTVEFVIVAFVTNALPLVIPVDKFNVPELMSVAI